MQRFCAYHSSRILLDPEENERTAFGPAFHPERLAEPNKLQHPARVFVVNMGDLMGSWVPQDWIEQVIEVVRSCPRHTFQFLTKNPKRYMKFAWPENAWLGATATDQKSWDHAVYFLKYLSHRPRVLPIRFVSVEPLLTRIYPHTLKYLDWLIIGAMTGPGAAPHRPERAWVEELMDKARGAGVPVFLKSNLKSVMPEIAADPAKYQKYPDLHPVSNGGCKP